MNICDVKYQAVSTNQYENARYNQLEKSNTVKGTSYLEMLQAVDKTVQNFEDMWKKSFEKVFRQSSSQFFYHVMDFPTISENIWQHNDFPYDKLMQKEVDSSVFSWQPLRGNPSQLDSRVQVKTQATLGKNAIIVPPELEERMRSDPRLVKRVTTNINKIYEFHRPMPHLTMPGTKFYGTKMYGSVIVLNKDGEVEHSCVTSGGGIIGPDEKTLRQIELEQDRKMKRKEENQVIAKEAELEYIDNRIEITRYLQGELI